MSLSLAITLIFVLDAALIGLLAFVMSRAGSLTPHVSSSEVAPKAIIVAERAQTQDAHPARRTGRVGRPALPARS